MSDPRNPDLLKMFQLLGLGERAGSGFQRIVRAWREQNWLVPLVSEAVGLEMTEISLPLASIIPEDAERELRALVGDAYSALDELSRTILIMALAPVTGVIWMCSRSAPNIPGSLANTSASGRVRRD